MRVNWLQIEVFPLSVPQSLFLYHMGDQLKTLMISHMFKYVLMCLFSLCISYLGFLGGLSGSLEIHEYLV